MRLWRSADDGHEAAILRAAAQWADLHPPDSVDDAAYVDGTEGRSAIAGDGAPLVVEFACAELAAARARFDPDQAEQERRAAADRRCFDVDHQQVSFSGTSRVYGELDLADALDLDAAVAAGAEHPGWGRRRASTCAPRSRSATSRGASSPSSSPWSPITSRRAPSARREAPSGRALRAPVRRRGGRQGSGLTGGERRRGSAGHLRPSSSVVRPPERRGLVEPVIDLADHVSVDAHEVPDRLADRAGLTHPTCVFPWCTRPARRCDRDHGVAYDDAGPTCDCNLAPLCRFHHRLKTHGRWVFTRVDETTILWRSPNGLTLLRDHTGTRDVSGGLPLGSLRDPPDT